jgi:hypothetical protein
MDTIFGAGSSKELFSWRNGLILHQVVEAAPDKGVIAIVPLLRLNTTRFEKIKRFRKDMEAGELTANERQKLKAECTKLRDEINQEDNKNLLGWSHQQTRATSQLACPVLDKRAAESALCLVDVLERNDNYELK